MKEERTGEYNERKYMEDIKMYGREEYKNEAQKRKRDKENGGWVDREEGKEKRKQKAERNQRE